MARAGRPKLAVWKFASCDGCQLALLDAEAELLELAEHVDIAHFLEASSDVRPGPYDISIVEGSVATAADRRRIRRVRRASRRVLAVGACATAGGIQALRDGFQPGAGAERVYPRPDWLDALDRSTPIGDHIEVDLALGGCPVDRDQLLEVLAAWLVGRRPNLPQYPVCVECKRRGTACVVVTRGTPCLGPVTVAGCGALCPRHGRGCYGCFGPQADAPLPAMSRRLLELGLSPSEVAHAYRGFCAGDPQLRREVGRHGPR